MFSTNLWSLIEKDPYNPHFWTELVQVAEESQNFEGIVRAYEGFLHNFPLMHIYWNKLALLIKNKTSSPRESINTFVKSVAPNVLQFSVDMWYCYCDFINTFSVEFSENDVRSVFEQAISFVGNDYNSDTIWSMYINWEEKKGNIKNTAALFSVVLTKPIRNLEKFWESFEKHISRFPVEDVVTTEENNEIDQIVRDIIEKNDFSPSESITRVRKEQTLELRKRKYSEAVQAVSQKILYEMKIKRTYFHFQRPNESQLANWNQYLTFVESLGDINQTKYLYERALIPCSLCPEIWIRYANFILANEGQEFALSLLERAADSPLKADPLFIHLHGLFLESIGDSSGAGYLFEKLDLLAPSIDGIIYYAFRMIRTGSSPVDYLQKQLISFTEPIDITLICTVLSKLGKDIDTDLLISKCKTIPLALSLVIDQFSKNNCIADCIEVYKKFLFVDSPMSLENKQKIIPSYIRYLVKNKLSFADIRAAQQLQVEIEKQIRLSLLEERREETKNLNDLSDVMDRWIEFFQEYDSLPQDYLSKII